MYSQQRISLNGYIFKVSFYYHPAAGREPEGIEIAEIFTDENLTQVLTDFPSLEHLLDALTSRILDEIITVRHCNKHQPQPQEDDWS